jgi:peptidoglycan/LPS O-acetylase OafA/YrhL
MSARRDGGRRSAPENFSERPSRRAHSRELVGLAIGAVGLLGCAVLDAYLGFTTEFDEFADDYGTRIGLDIFMATPFLAIGALVAARRLSLVAAFVVASVAAALVVDAYVTIWTDDSSTAGFAALAPLLAFFLVWIAWGVDVVVRDFRAQARRRSGDAPQD